ncbi:MAG: Mov34/MPN/PAD-1 family protein [Alphaproteobacteria bacterium]|nr:Mov34/MPN/PAD-1 family protein [Alphaproteobacteria bacterium]
MATTPSAPALSDEIARTRRVISAHPNVVEVSPVCRDPKTNAWSIEIALQLGLPNAWMAEGHSPNGVRAIETVTMWFPATYPLRAPVIRLRQDFDRSLAHVQPDTPDTRPRPCLFDGNLAELVQQRGIAVILNQLVLWLERAALQQLIDPEQGWEAVRRDELDDLIIADGDALRALVTRKGGHAAFVFEYAALIDGGRMLHGEVRTDRVTFNPKTVGDLFTRLRPEPKDRWKIGRSIAIVAWPGQDNTGKPVIADRYRPETVTDIASLKARAADFGCAPGVNSALSWLETCVRTWRLDGTTPIAIILCARRPFHLIGSDSSIELCPYVINIGAPTLLPAGDQTSVRPAGHRQTVAPTLLRRLSDDPETTQEEIKWVQLGCGSLGSKIALHLARAGRAPAIVIDRAYLSPHHAARHALVPRKGGMQVSWIGDKAAALAEAIAGLGQTANAVADDVVLITRDKIKAKKHLPKRSWAIVNSTASLAAREAMGSIARDIQIPRVIETILYSAGTIGVVTVEGPNHNPNTLDLVAETYTIVREQDALRAVMFAEGAGLTRQSIGEGCGSLTMPMSDARLSMFAAPMAEAITAMQKAALPDKEGRILLGAIAEDSVSLTWSSYGVAPSTAVRVAGQGGWQVRISGRAEHKIKEEVARWPTVETGGILMGRMSDAARTFYVTDVLPAPDDSKRSAVGFQLGVKGARKRISDYAESCGYSLFCLGTWHSHLYPSGPSATDHATAVTVGLARFAPSVLLIHTPGGYAVVLAEASRSTMSGPEAGRSRTGER